MEIFSLILACFVFGWLAIMLLMLMVVSLRLAWLSLFSSDLWGTR